MRGKQSGFQWAARDFIPTVIWIRPCSRIIRTGETPRDSSATLTSNPSATPVVVSQDRGYREGYARADLAGHHGHHDWKTGVDSIFSPVHEALQYAITDPTQLDPGTQLNFQFPYQRKWDVEPSYYAQDQLRLERWNVTVGLRFAHYGLIV